LREIIAYQPQWHRTALSRHLCEVWILKYTRRWDAGLPARTQSPAGHRPGLRHPVWGKRTITRPLVPKAIRKRIGRPTTRLLPFALGTRSLFNPILEGAIQTEHSKRIVTRFDDIRVGATARPCPKPKWHRDPLGTALPDPFALGPPLAPGQPGAAALTNEMGKAPRARFRSALRWPRWSRKPGKKATESRPKGVSALKKEKEPLVQFVAMAQELRQHLDQSGQANKPLILVGDGFFCNRTVFAPIGAGGGIAGGALFAKDIGYVNAHRENGRRFYAQPSSPRAGAPTGIPGPLEDPLGSFTEAATAGAFTRRWARLIGKGGLRNSRCACWWWPGRLSHQQERTQNTIVKPAYLFDHGPEHPGGSIAPRTNFDRWALRSITGMRRKSWGWARRRCWNEHSVSNVAGVARGHV